MCLCDHSIFFFLFLLFFFFVPTTDLKRNNSCNYSVRLVLTILSSFFAYLSIMYSFAVLFYAIYNSMRKRRTISNWLEKLFDIAIVVSINSIGISFFSRFVLEEQTFARPRLLWTVEDWTTIKAETPGSRLT